MTGDKIQKVPLLCNNLFISCFANLNKKEECIGQNTCEGLSVVSRQMYRAEAQVSQGLFLITGQERHRGSIWKHNLLSLTVLYSLACHGFEPVVLTSLSTHCICDVCPELQVLANFIQGYGGDRRENVPLYRPVFPRAVCTIQSMY